MTVQSHLLINNGPERSFYTTLLVFSQNIFSVTIKLRRDYRTEAQTEPTALRSSKYCI